MHAAAACGTCKLSSKGQLWLDPSLTGRHQPPRVEHLGQDHRTLGNLRFIICCTIWPQSNAFRCEFRSWAKKNWMRVQELSERKRALAPKSLKTKQDFENGKRWQLRDNAARHASNHQQIVSNGLFTIVNQSCSSVRSLKQQPCLRTNDYDTNLMLS